MAIVGLAAVFLIISLIELPNLIRGKMWRELGVFAGVMVAAMGLTFGQALGFHIPSPAKEVEKILQPISQWIQGYVMQ